MKAKLPYTFTKKQDKVLNREITKQLLERDKDICNDMDAMFLWGAHVAFGFGPKRLKLLYDEVRRQHQELINYYQMNENDSGWLTRYKLKEIGVDIEQWNEASPLIYKSDDK